MSAWTVLLVGVGAAVGAPLRYLADAAAKARFGSSFPWGTFVVNVAGSFVLGVVVGASAQLPPAVGTLVGTGFCGALTTYSTFGHELVSLCSPHPVGSAADRPPAERRATRTALAYLLTSVALGVAAAAAGWILARTAL